MFHQNGRESVSLTPIIEDVVWKQNSNCAQKQRGWLAFGVKNVRRTGKKTPFGQSLIEFDAVFRHCINGEVQPVRYRLNQIDYETSSLKELHQHAFELALDDFFGRTEAIDLDNVNCWSLSIIANNPEFLEDFAEYAQINSQNWGSHSVLKHLGSLRKLTLAQVSSEDIQQALENANVEISVSI